MTDDASNPSSHQASVFAWKKIGIILLILLLIMGLTAGSLFAYFAYIKWNHLKTTLKNQHQQYQAATNKLQKNIDHLQQNLERSQTTLNEQAQVLKQIEGIEKGNVDSWRALSAAYLVRLANDQVTFTHDTNVLPLLERAIEVLQAAQDPALRKIQQTLRADVLRFKAIPVINTEALYNQLITLNQQLDTLPMRSLNPVVDRTVKPETHQDLPWWKAGWRHSMNVLKKIIIVHRQEDKALPFILPQETTLLYQSMHAQLQNAIWGLLHQTPSIYETSLSQLINWIQQYLDVNASQTQAVISHLQTLKNQSIRPTNENLAATLAQFDQYFAAQDQPPSSP